MRKRNPSQASLPNAPIELTPLLDVIFIFLFIVLVATAIIGKDVEEKADEVQKLIDTQNEEEARGYALEERLKYYEKGVLGTNTRIITVYCKYSDVDIERRVLEVLRR